MNLVGRRFKEFESIEELFGLGSDSESTLGLIFNVYSYACECRGPDLLRDNRELLQLITYSGNKDPKKLLSYAIRLLQDFRGYLIRINPTNRRNTNRSLQKLSIRLSRAILSKCENAIILRDVLLGEYCYIWHFLGLTNKENFHSRESQISNYKTKFQRLYKAADEVSKKYYITFKQIEELIHGVVACHWVVGTYVSKNW